MKQHGKYSWITICVLAGGIFGCSTPLTPASKETGVEIMIEDVTEQAELAMSDGAQLVLPPDSLLSPGTVLGRIVSSDQISPLPPDISLVSEIYDFSVEETELVEAAGITLPYDDSSLTDAEEDAIIPLYFDGANWVELDQGLVDPAENRVSFTTNHFSSFGLGFIGTQRPSVTLIATPSVYETVRPDQVTGLGFNHGIDDDLIFTAVVHDPDHLVTGVDIRFQFYNFGSQGVEAMVGLTRTVVSAGHLGYGLVGAPFVVNDLVNDAFLLEGRPWSAINYTEMRELEPGSGSYNSRLALSSIRWSEPGGDIETILPPDRITATIRVTYGNRTRETSIDVHFIDYAASEVDLVSPGPTVAEITGQSPVFSWGYRTPTKVQRIRLLVARGETLWDRFNFLGVGYVVDLSQGIHDSYNSVVRGHEYQVSRSLPPGQYSWGVIVSVDERLGNEDDVYSAIYRFTVVRDSEMPTETPMPTFTSTSIPTATLTSTPTQTVSPTSAPTQTPAPSSDAVVIASGSKNITLHAEPSWSVPPALVIQPGDPVKITHVFYDHSWYRIQLPDGTVGWIAAEFLQVNIDTASIPIGGATDVPRPTTSSSGSGGSGGGSTPRPAATSAPPSGGTPNVDFSMSLYGGCLSGRFTYSVLIRNSGNSTLDSFRARFSGHDSRSSSFFQNHSGCSWTGEVGTLEPGQAGWAQIYGPVPDDGGEYHLELTLCTAAGDCRTKNYHFIYHYDGNHQFLP
jgi:hypothetical protein